MFSASTQVLRRAAKEATNAAKRQHQKQQLRFLNIHEYQSSKLMESFGVNVPPGIACHSVQEVLDAAKKIGGEEVGGKRGHLHRDQIQKPLYLYVWAEMYACAKVVVKSQILAGGRGLGTFTNGFKGG
eukprot:scaffold176734_cov49-Prasinocladus_malaysianus.AAC.1